MKYGAMNFPIRPIIGEIEEIGRLGFDYVELTMDPPEATPQKILKQRREILAVLSSYDMGIIAHLPIFLDTSSLYQSIRTASLREQLDALEAAAELGITKAVLHPGYITGLARLMRDKVEAHIREGLEVVLRKARELGVMICLENLFPEAHSLTGPEEFRDVFTKYPELRLALDVGHANIGTDTNRSFEFIELYGTRIGHVHANDNFGREDSHLPIGAGTVEFYKILGKLKRTDYDDTLTVEVFSRDRDYLRISRDKLRELWER